MMLNTKMIISLVKTKARITSDYRLSKLLGLEKATVSAWRRGRTQIGEKAASEVSEILSVDVCVLYAALQAERTSDPSSKLVWLKIYEKLNGHEVAQRLINEVFPDGLPEDLKV